MSLRYCGGPEAQRTGQGVRRYPPPPPPKITPEQMAEALKPPDPIMRGRHPHRDSMGQLDLTGLPTTRTPLAHHTPQTVNSGMNWQRARDVQPKLSYPAGVGTSLIAGPERPRTSLHEMRSMVTRRPTTPPAPLSASSSERWLQIRDELGETKEEVFIGNNLRDVSRSVSRTSPHHSNARPTPLPPAGSMSSLSVPRLPAERHKEATSNPHS